MKLARSWGVKVVERKISIDEIYAAHGTGELKEVFGSGTAAVISPVGNIKFNGKEITIGDGSVGPLSAKLFKNLMDIQYGKSRRHLQLDHADKIRWHRKKCFPTFWVVLEMTQIENVRYKASPSFLASTRICRKLQKATP